MTPPIIPTIVSKFDTSNFANSKKKYEEEETKNPFYTGRDETDEPRAATNKTAISSESFGLIRADFLRQMNEEDIQKLE